MQPTEILKAVATELEECLIKISPENMEAVVEELSKAKMVFLAGAGRSALGIRGFAMRLMHMGRTVCVVGETTTPGIKKGDLLVVGSGSGRTASLLAMAQKAKHVGARLLLVTIDPKSPIGELADCIVQIPAPSPKAQSEKLLNKSIQPMGSLFEQCLLLFLDSTVLLMMDRENLSSDEMFANHANLE
jgi:6-phospho-3-hexuloisomerase